MFQPAMLDWQRGIALSFISDMEVSTSNGWVLNPESGQTL